MAPETSDRATDDQDDQDRVVSRKVDNPTLAEPGDDAAYRAAQSAPGSEPAANPAGTSTTGTPGTSTATAAAEMDAENESEPDRSE